MSGHAIVAKRQTATDLRQDLSALPGTAPSFPGRSTAPIEEWDIEGPGSANARLRASPARSAFPSYLPESSCDLFPVGDAIVVPTNES
jgi:hypothetical protein